MSDDAWEKRRIELEEAFGAAYKALALHMGTDSFSGEVKGLASTHPYATGEFARDYGRMMAVERLQLNIGPGESFQEDVPWIASFTTDDHVHVLAGQTLREVIDKAIAASSDNAPKTS